MYVFIDESGELSNYTPTGSKYFICTAVLMPDLVPILALYELRHQLEQEGYPLTAGFHAKNDPMPRRRRVFQTLASTTIFIHSVALLKNEVYANLRNDEAFVYRIAGRRLLHSLLTKHLATSELHSFVFASYGAGETARRLQSFLKEAITREFGSTHNTRVAFWDANSHAGLQIADYCSWMIQRHLENPQQPVAQEFQTMMAARVVELIQPFDR